jgi:hypothetical protein
MHHDRQMLKTANSELLNLGVGQIAYLRKLQADETRELPEFSDPDNTWGLFSANGEPLALCDSPQSAWHYAKDHELITVHLH